MNKRKSKLSLTSYLLVAALVMILGLFAWTSERDYEYQQEIAELREVLLAAESECGPTIELSMPVDLGVIQL